MRRRIKSVKISVGENFLKKLDREKERFMKKYGLKTLTTTAFTNQNNITIKVRSENDKRKKR